MCWTEVHIAPSTRVSCFEPRRLDKMGGVTWCWRTVTFLMMQRKMLSATRNCFISDCVFVLHSWQACIMHHIRIFHSSWRRRDCWGRKQCAIVDLLSNERFSHYCMPNFSILQPWKQSNCLLVCNNAPCGAADLSLLTTGICFVTRRRLLHKVAASGNCSTNSTYRTLDHASYPARFPQYLDSKYACLCCNIQSVCKNHSNFDVSSLWRG